VSVPLIPLVLAGVLAAAGVYLLLDRSLTRVLLGILVLGNAVNVVVVTAGGPSGAAPLVGKAAGPMSDALVQALVLTAVVITLGVAAFVLALIHRTWTLEREDDLAVDTEDRAVQRRLERDEQDDEDELDTTGCEAVSDTDDERAGSVPTDTVPSGAAGARE
jgi:multicomponent Na+:H+ antiporter subunit C